MSRRTRTRRTTVAALAPSTPVPTHRGTPTPAAIERTRPGARPVLLGIEAGGTRTVAIAVEAGSRGTGVRREFPAANLYLLDDQRLRAHLKAIASAMPSPRAVAIGMAGARTDGDRARLRHAAAHAWPGVPCHATNDLETALLAAGDPPAHAGRAERRGRAPQVRVLIVSGTGSCCYARTDSGLSARLGGWGHVIGDKGSGYDVTIRALEAVVQAADRRRTWPDLGKRFLRALVLNEPHELVAWVQTATKAEIAALAVEVFRAADAGDRMAVDVLRDTARVLAANGADCARLLVSPDMPVHFVLAGGVLQHQHRLAALLRRLLYQAWPSAVVTVLDREGAWGAVELASRQLQGALPLDEVGHERLRAPAVPAIALPDLRSLATSPTEQRNPRSTHLDRMSIASALTLMFEEDARIPHALLAHRAGIARGVAMIANAFKRGGRLFYAGAGTSGRLGVLDASECPPTFRTPPDMVQGIIAGGTRALWTAVEGAEDDPLAGRLAIESRGVADRDVVVGIAASGRTPFVWGALAEAARRGARTILLCFNPHLEVPRGQRPSLVIAVDMGPEILTGSTRLKAGTATKLVLNAFTTLAMVRIGKVRSNLMIDLNASNVKLRDRAVRIVRELTGVDGDTAREALERADWRVATAYGRIAGARRRRGPRDGGPRGEMGPRG